MPYIIKNNEIKMFYNDYGRGDVIVFIHGSIARGQPTFSAQIGVFSSQYRCIVPDLRGHGNTSANSTHWTTPQLADDIIFLLDSLQIQKAYIVGHSMGGDVSMYMAVKYPERVKSVVSICSAGVPNDEVIKFLQRFKPEQIDRDKYKILIETIKTEHFAAHNGNWEAFLRETIYNCENYPCFTEKDLQRIISPFLLIYGGKDAMVKNSEIETLSKNVCYFRSYKINEAGHFPHVVGQNSDEVNKLIEDFINERI